MSFYSHKCLVVKNENYKDNIHIKKQKQYNLLSKKGKQSNLK